MSHGSLGDCLKGLGLFEDRDKYTERLQKLSRLFAACTLVLCHQGASTDVQHDNPWQAAKQALLSFLDDAIRLVSWSWGCVLPSCQPWGLLVELVAVRLPALTSVRAS